MHQIYVVTSLKVLPVRKVCLSELEFSFSSIPLLFPFQIQLQCSSPFQKTSFPVYCFRALSFSTVLSKCIFILRYLCFLGKNHQCRMYTNFLDDGRYTDAVPSTQKGHARLFSLVCPDNVKPTGASWMQMNMIAYNVKYSY
jgi:hypothetical protein